MIQFSLGISLIILSLFIGISQYFDNEDKIQGAQNRFERTQQKVREMGQFSTRLERARKLALEAGQDQRARVEDRLELPEMGLELRFTSSPRPDSPDRQFFYRHEFQISGQATFFDMIKLLNTLENSKGFVVNYACIRCDNVAVDEPEEGKEPVTIRGYLNVYNPEQV